MSSYHKILRVNKGATKAQIKNAYRKLAKEFHPDRNDAPNAKEKFIEIAEAYEVLYDGKIAKRRAQQKKKASQTRSTKEKYWHVYSPPRNEQARAEWERVDAERRQYYRERAKRNAEKRYQKFKEETEAFKKSIFYYPLLWFYYAVQVVAIIGNGAILFLPFMGTFIDPEEYGDASPTGVGAFFVILILSPLVFMIFNQMRILKKTIDPYFYGY